MLVFFLVLLFVIFSASPSFAAGSDVPAMELDEIVVTSRRSPVSAGESASDIEVVSAADIQRLPARNLSDVLAAIPGVYLDTRQEFGRATSVSMRGSDARQVRVMIDGIPLNTQVSGQVNPAKFPIENIERIEVIKGPASSVWGSGLGGVVNVITKGTGATAVPSGSLTSSFAGHGTQSDSGELSGKIGDVGYYVYTGYMESGGDKDRDDVLERKVSGRISYDLHDAGMLEGIWGYSRGDVSGGVFPDGTWQSDPYRCSYGKLGWKRSDDDTDFRIDLKNSRQGIYHSDYDTAASEEPWRRVTSKDVMYEASFVSSMKVRERDLFVAGADLDWTTLTSTYLARARDVQVQAPYANYSLKLGPWDVNPGIRFDRNSEFGNDVSPSLGFVYHTGFLRESLVRVQVARAFNAPPLLWKYYGRAVSGVTGDNPDLTAERAVVYEAGFESRPVKPLRIKISVFRSDISDAISNARNSDGLWIKKNFKKFRRQGAESHLIWEVFEGFSFSAGGAFVDIEDRATKKPVRDGDSPRQSFDLGASYENRRGFAINLNGRHDHWYNTYDWFLQRDQRFIFDLKTSQRFRNVLAFFNVRNLFNTRYYADYYYPAPGRYYEGGVTVSW